MLYVDNMRVVGDKAAVKEFKKERKMIFNTKEEGTLDEYVCCKVTRKGNELHMFHPDIIEGLWNRRQGDWQVPDTSRIWFCSTLTYQRRRTDPS